jgi:NAD(P) transhydrogenase subunit alpha
LKLAILRETAPGETRVAATPETVKKLIALGASIAVETGAGVGASISDTAFTDAGATVGDRALAIEGADAILCVSGPEPDALAGAKPGALLVGSLDPFGRRAAVDGYAAAGLDALAMEWMPRITRAQSMDILSSQSNLAGYRAVLEASTVYGRAFPMMMTAAGTVSAARVFARRSARPTFARRLASKSSLSVPSRSLWRMSPASKARGRADTPAR